jgi:hypothetical protein
MRWCVILASALWLLTSSGLRAQQPPDANPKAENCSIDERNCGLSGISIRTRYEALWQSIIELGGDYYFPVDILAASFSLEDRGWKFSPHLWSLRRSRMEAVFSREKRLMLDPDDPLTLVTVDVPGIGPRAYDADIIRTLIPTELFPYRMIVISKKRNGTKVDFVKLDRRGGELAKTCFKEVVDTGIAACPDALRQKRQNAIRMTVPNPMNRFPGNAVFQFDGHGASDPGRSKGTSGTAELDALIKVLTALKADDDTIQLKYREVGVHCGSRSDLQSSEQNLIPSTVAVVCKLTLDLIIPRSAASAYFQVVVKGEITKPAGVAEVYCGPNNFDIVQADLTVKSPARAARADDFQWLLYDRVLRPLSTNVQELKVLIPVPNISAGIPEPASAKYSRAQQAIELKITLEGWPKPWLASWLIGKQRKSWCYPNGACP